MRSEQNVFVNSQPSDKTYVFKVHLFAGDPVEYQVLVQRVGFPDIVYNLPAHQDTDQTVEVFSMTALQLESAWQPLELDWRWPPTKEAVVVESQRRNEDITALMTLGMIKFRNMYK